VADPFVAEIRIFPFNFSPRGWAFCDGQLLPISQNTALFSLLGTYYGGDGKSTFALPNLQGSVPIQSGQSNTGSEYFIGQIGGSEMVTLLTSEMPFHNHSVQASPYPADYPLPAPDTVLCQVAGDASYSTQITPSAVMAFQSLGISGGSLPHNNLMPFLTLNFCIAMQGIFPPRG
jgi:microcystin-dependent protein